MALVFHRAVAVPLWAMAFFTVALTAIMFWMSGAIRWLRTSRPVACVRPSGHRDHASAAITLAAETRVGAIEEPNRREADDALDLVRMDDDGGWQMTRPPA